MAERMADRAYRDEYYRGLPEVVFIRALYKACARFGLPQEEILKKAGLSEEDVEAFVDGRYSPCDFPMSVYTGLAELLGESVRVVFSEEK